MRNPCILKKFEDSEEGEFNQSNCKLDLFRVNEYVNQAFCICSYNSFLFILKYVMLRGRRNYTKGFYKQKLLY